MSIRFVKINCQKYRQKDSSLRFLKKKLSKISSKKFVKQLLSNLSNKFVKKFVKKFIKKFIKKFVKKIVKKVKPQRKQFTHEENENHLSESNFGSFRSFASPASGWEA